MGDRTLGSKIKLKIVSLATISLTGFLVSTPQFSLAQWAQTAGPEGDYVFCIATDSLKVYVSSNGGVLASTNSGVSWTPTGFHQGSASVLYSTGSNLYVGTMGSGIYTSTDGGTSWSTINSGLAYIGAWRFNVIAKKDSTLYAACWAPMNDMGDYPPGGLFRSTNNGGSWMNTSLPTADVEAIAAMGTKVYAATGSGIFVSTDNGVYWSPAGLAYMPVSAIVTKGAVLFAGVAGAGVFCSSDEGASWRATNLGLLDLDVRYLATDGQSVYAATDSSVFSSPDSGGHWISADSGLKDTYILALAARRGELFAGTYGDGVFHSDDGGKKWKRMDAGLVHTLVSALRVIGTTVLAGTYAPGRIFTSSNCGAGWIPARPGPAVGMVRNFTEDGTTIFAATSYGVFRSTDGGSSWAVANAGLDNKIVESILVRGNKLFAACEQDPMNPFLNVLFTSTDSGTTWAATEVGYPYSFHCMAQDSKNLYAGCNIGVLRSTDEGTTWDYLGPMAGNQAVYSLALCGGSLLAGTEAGGVAVSSDQGRNWLETDLTNTGVFDLIGVSASGPVFAGTSKGVFLSTNGGRNWTPANAGLVSTVPRVAADSRYIYGATGGAGVWRRALSEILASVALSPSALSTFNLFQNYPNPFNPSTTIRYAIPHRTHVTLTMFNTLGQQAAILVDEDQEAGYHDVRFDASGLASGVYFYRLRAGDNVATKRLILVR